MITREDFLQLPLDEQFLHISSTVGQRAWHAFRNGFAPLSQTEAHKIIDRMVETCWDRPDAIGWRFYHTLLEDDELLEAFRLLVGASLVPKEDIPPMPLHPSTPENRRRHIRLIKPNEDATE